MLVLCTSLIKTKMQTHPFLNVTHTNGCFIFTHSGISSGFFESDFRTFTTNLLPSNHHFSCSLIFKWSLSLEEESVKL